MVDPGLLSKFTNSGHKQVNSISETCHRGGVNQLMEHINRKSLFLVQQQHHDVVTEAEIERPQFVESNIIIYKTTFSHLWKAFNLSQIHSTKFSQAKH